MSPNETLSVRGRAIVGDFFHAPTRQEVAFLRDTMLLVDPQGYIARILPPDDPARAAAERDHKGNTLRLPAGNCVMPGFVDLHVHAPQYPQLGLALDVALEVWLQSYTFPLEAQYRDLDFARPRYEQLVDDLLALGTTTALYFATQDPDASMLLADICLEKGQRALVGKVAMDDPASCPSDYRDASAEAAVAGTRRVIEHIRAHPDNAHALVLPVVTPRFTPSCTEAALAGLGALAAEYNCHVQTHASESDWAHGHALNRFGITDAQALDRFGLLTRRSVLAHGNFLTDDDFELLRQRGSAIAHCALSNAYFANSVFPLRRALEKQVKIGLGSDISGGPSPSMFATCCTTLQVSRMLADGVDAAKPASQRGSAGAAVDLVTAFHLATAGGGQALGLPVGTFAPGQKFDAICIDPSAEDGGIRLFGGETPRERFEKILYGAQRANISATWVDGKSVRRRQALQRA